MAPTWRDKHDANPPILKDWRRHGVNGWRHVFLTRKSETIPCRIKITKPRGAGHTLEASHHTNPETEGHMASTIVPLPAHARVLELLTYDPATGHFTWKVSTSPSVKAGVRAGLPDSRGRSRIRIDGRCFESPLIAWIYMTGHGPSKGIAFKNGNNRDTRWENLFDATPRKNCATSAKRFAST